MKNLSTKGTWTQRSLDIEVPVASQRTLILATAIGYTVWQDGKAFLLKTLHHLVAGHKKSDCK